MNEHHSKKMDESLKSDYRNNVLFCISNTWKIHYPTRTLLYIYIGRPSMNLVSIVLIPLPCNTSQLTDYMCAGLGRKGQLCGSCKKDFALAVYSYSMKCVSCKTFHTINLFKLIWSDCLWSTESVCH